jgi:type IV pilus assembly protein PilA
MKTINKNKSGVTLVELLAVVVIIGILTAIAIPTVGGLISRSKDNADRAVVINLNEATSLYLINATVEEQELFVTATTNGERFNILFDYGFIDKIPSLNNPDSSISWNEANLDWELINDALPPAIPPISFNFASDRLTGIPVVYTNGDFSDHGDYISATREKLFIANPNEQYIINTSAALMPSSSNSGGYGVFFDTSLNSNNLETGYVAQFDRGFDGGSVIIRRRYVSGNTTAEANPSARVQVKFDALGNPSPTVGTAKASNQWWTAKHEFSINISLFTATNTNKKAEIFIDGQLFLTWFFSSPLIGTVSETNVTGFRAWACESRFYGISIEKK